MIKFTFITAALISLLVSCTQCTPGKQVVSNNNSQKTNTTTGSFTDSLYDRKWYLVKINTDKEVREVTDRKAFIRFNSEQGSAGGNGSCNSFGSTLKTDGKTISITDIFSTKMYCDAVQSVEDSFFAQLHKVNRYEVKGKTLLLYDKEKVLLEFVEGK